MTFADTLLATLIGALVGAMVGALAAWLFALDLRRREGDQADRARLDAAVADVVQLLGEIGGVVQAFDFAMKLANPGVVAPPPHATNQRLLSAVLVARMAAGDEEGPLLATYALVTRRDDRTANRQAIDYEHAAHMLVQWRRGKISTADAEAQVMAGSPAPVAPDA